MKSLYILTKKCPDRHKNLDYWYLLYKYGHDTQNFNVFFTLWMKTSIKFESWKIYQHPGDICPPNRYRSFLSTPTPSAAAVNWSGSEARFEETQDQLLPRHFENAGSNLFFNIECSYLVNIKANHSRIWWYKNIYSPKYLSPAYVSVSEGGVCQSFPWQGFLT